MAAGILLLFRSTGFLVLTGLFLSYLIAALVLKRAVKRAEEGYEDEVGFHYGSPGKPVKPGSRPAQPTRPSGKFSCPHCRLQKITGTRRRLFRRCPAPPKIS